MSLSRQRVFLFLVALAIESHLFVADIRAEDPLGEVCAGNKAALDSISTLSGRMTVNSLVSPVPGRSGAAVADFWQSGDSFRLRTADQWQTTDSVHHNSIGKGLNVELQPEQRTVFFIRRVEPDKATSRFDPYASGLLRLYGLKARPLTLEQLLSQKQKPTKISREPYEGRDCIVLHISAKYEEERGDFDIWFDPKVKHLACRLVGNFSGNADRPSVRRESTVLKFMEPAPGVFFPSEAETKFFTGKKLTQHDLVTFSDVRINTPLPADVFELPIPANAIVLDQIQDREYKTDASGKEEAGSSRPLAKGIPTPAGKPAPPGKSGKPTPSVQSSTAVSHSATTKEPEPMTRWVLYGLLAVLAIAGGIWYVRRLRATAT